MLDWQAFFTLQDYAADYRTAIAAWIQTDTTKHPFHEVMHGLFPQYAPGVARQQPADDDVYEWTWEDRKVFDRIIASLPKE